MTDFHSHILPGMDDGSRSIEESTEMLKALSQQGISRVVATPHFYANDESVFDFLERRREAYEKLSAVLITDMPEVVLGAEVRYYDGISRLAEIKSLCIQGTDLFLLEMPEKRWTEYTLRELEDIACTGRVTLVLAHVDRCMGYQRPDTLYRLHGSGVMMQMNAEYINGFFTRRKAVSMIKNGAVCFVGSDCHNMTDRKPEIGKAYDIIKNRLGEEFTDSLRKYTNEILKAKNLKG